MAATKTATKTVKSAKVTSTSKTATEPEVKQEATKKIVAKSVDVNQYIPVINGFQGRLIYKSKRTGEVTVWDEFGSEQEMELLELKNAKSSFKTFFINNWFMFDDDFDWVIDYLGVRKYYANSISISNFDDIFMLKPTLLKKTLAGLSNGQKKSVAYRASELISEGGLDSLSVINTLEECLGIELIEK